MASDRIRAVAPTGTQKDLQDNKARRFWGRSKVIVSILTFSVAEIESESEGAEMRAQTSTGINPSSDSVRRSFVTLTEVVSMVFEPSKNLSTLSKTPRTLKFSTVIRD